MGPLIPLLAVQGIPPPELHMEEEEVHIRRLIGQWW